MMNMQNLMKQAQKMQKQMEQKQIELANSTFIGKSAQDLVIVQVTGDKQVRDITFAQVIVDPEDLDTLKDMTIQALNNAFTQVDEVTQKSLGAFTGKLPF